MQVQMRHPETGQPVVLTIGPDDIVVVRLTDDDKLDDAVTLASQIKHTFDQQDIDRTIVLVGEGVTVEGLSPEQMRKAGWVRADDAGEEE